MFLLFSYDDTNPDRAKDLFEQAEKFAKEKYDHLVELANK